MEQVRLSDITSRTFGWVQNPGDFGNLKKVVQLFDQQSDFHKQLKNDIIPRIVAIADGRDTFITLLNQVPVAIDYASLIGTSFNPRSSARCNGIIQASVCAQGGREFIDDWSSNGFLRWAHALGFIDYCYGDDTFKITQKGINFSTCVSDSTDEKNILIDAVLAYPPAVRVLDLLSNGDHLTKFYIGKRLGFNGENGFTSLPEGILIDTLANTGDQKIRTKYRQNWEGSSDKYARMIASWLVKLGLVSKLKKVFNVRILNGTESISISHAFKITADGLSHLRRARGTNRASRIVKNICWEMLATKVADKDYVRTRRAIILKTLDSTTGLVPIDVFITKLATHGLTETEGTIINDIKGLISIGLNIELSTRGYRLYDTITDFVLPSISGTTVVKSHIERAKEDMRTQLTHISHDYIELIEIGQDPQQHRLFEMKVVELFVDEYGFKGFRLGESRKPDGTIYTDDLDTNYGIIIDTKAYKGGYNLPISQADEMERYIRENISRNEAINPNKWWDVFPEELDEFCYLFVSGFFKGKFEDQLVRVCTSTGVSGAALSVEHLLYGAEYIKRGILTLEDFKEKFTNTEILL